jgi:hypothetical protein
VAVGGIGLLGCWELGIRNWGWGFSSVVVFVVFGCEGQKLRSAQEKIEKHYLLDYQLISEIKLRTFCALLRRLPEKCC